MTESKASSETQARRRIGRAPRRPVDSQGRPIGPPIVYKYDDDGILVSAEPAKDPQ